MPSPPSVGGSAKVMSGRSPRVILGAPLFNKERDFREAIESVLSQTFTDFALVLVDDCSTDGTPAVAREYAALDSRVTFRANEQRLGMIDNCRRVFAVAREMHPDAEYFAWISDHDIWHPRWLAQLVEALDGNRDAVLAYPLNRRIGAAGEVLARKPWAFDTAGVTGRWSRLWRGLVGMSAGNMVYGLFRAELLERAGVYRQILVPDRLLFTELALYGQFTQVPQVLWFRRWYGRVFSLDRQRRNFFVGGRPLYAYVPWWISHAASLFWNFTVRGIGRPAVGRGTGVLVALWCLAFSGLFHLWQLLRALRGWVLERAVVLLPYDRRIRALFREVRRRGIADWTWSHMKRAIGLKALRRLRRRARNAAFETMRMPYVFGIRTVRAIPFVRNRIIPSLLQQELDQIPVAPATERVRQELERLAKSDAPIVIGPWVGEVGYELLYWIPFLNWALKAHGLEGRRLIVISRGGARPWYQHLTREYVDVFELFSLDEYREANEQRWDQAGHQKQYEIAAMDREIVDRARARLGLGNVDILHPWLLYKVLRFYWFEKAGVGTLKQHTDYRPLAPVERSAALKHLPAEYIAVRFYFRPSFPDTPENRALAANVIRSITREMPVVLLNTGLTLDDHEDLAVAGGGVHRVDHLMTPERNLEIQTEIIANARGFVGTYGGLAYLGTFYGVPSIGIYSTQSELLPAHLDTWWRLGRAMDTPVGAVDARAEGMLRAILGDSAAIAANVKSALG